MNWKNEKKRLAEEVAESIYKSDAIIFGDIELTSSKSSTYYIDLRDVSSHPGQFRSVVKAMGRTLEEELRDTDKIAAIPTAGMPFGGAITYSKEIPMFYIREESKQHGRQRTIEGRLEQGDQVTLVDDLTTTGGSLIEAAEKVEKSGGVVDNALVVLNRKEGAIENLKKEGIDLHYVTDMEEAASYLHEEGYLSKERYDSIIDYIEEQQ